MGIKRYEVGITGIQPVVWSIRKRALDQEKKKIKKNELDEWEENPKNWKRKAEYKDEKPDGSGTMVVIPPRWIRAAMINACKWTRLVPHFATKKNESYTRYMESCLFEDGKPICKVDELEKFGAFCGVQNAKIWVNRPSLKEWKHSFTFVDPYGRMTKEELKELLDYAGMFVGIGDARKLNFGRFEISGIKEVEDDGRKNKGA